MLRIKIININTSLSGSLFSVSHVLSQEPCKTLEVVSYPHSTVQLTEMNKYNLSKVTQVVGGTKGCEGRH